MPNTKTDHEAIQNEAVSATEGAAPTPSLVSKKAGNKNALFHGIYSDEIILPWESPVDFEKLHSSLKDEWNPSGCSEEQAVFDLAHCTWIKWRAAKFAALRFHRAKFGKGFLKPGETTWQDIIKHEQEVPKAAEDALSEVQKLLGAMNDLLETHRNFSRDFKSTGGADTQSEITAILTDLRKTIDVNTGMVSTINTLAAVSSMHFVLFNLAYQPETIEQDIKVMAAIDARIDKILRRLTSLKEYKRVAASLAPASHRIASPSVIPANMSDETKQN